MIKTILPQNGSRSGFRSAEWRLRAIAAPRIGGRDRVGFGVEDTDDYGRVKARETKTAIWSRERVMVGR